MPTVLGSEGVTLACRVHMVPLRTKMYTAPEKYTDGLKYAPGAPTTAVFPSSATDAPRLEFVSASAAVGSRFACCDHVDPAWVNTYAAP